MMLRPVISVLRFCFVTIKSTLKLSFRFEIQKINVTLPSISASALFAAFIFESVAFETHYPEKTRNTFNVLKFWFQWHVSQNTKIFKCFVFSSFYNSAVFSYIFEWLLNCFLCQFFEQQVLLLHLLQHKTFNFVSNF